MDFNERENTRSGIFLPVSKSHCSQKLAKETYQIGLLA